MKHAFLGIQPFTRHNFYRMWARALAIKTNNKILPGFKLTMKCGRKGSQSKGFEFHGANFILDNLLRNYWFSYLPCNFADSLNKKHIKMLIQSNSKSTRNWTWTWNVEFIKLQSADKIRNKRQYARDFIFPLTIQSHSIKLP